MEKSVKTKILLPISLEYNKNVLVKGLAILTNLKEPYIIVFHAIELPVTATLDLSEHQEKVDEIKSKLKPFTDWIKKQSFEIKERIVVTRRITDAIIEEANSGNYDLLLLTKRRPPKGFRKIFYKSHTDIVTDSINCPALILVSKK
jgi:hypothetical protein